MSFSLLLLLRFVLLCCFPRNPPIFIYPNKALYYFFTSHLLHFLFEYLLLQDIFHCDVREIFGNVHTFSHNFKVKIENIRTDGATVFYNMLSNHFLKLKPSWLLGSTLETLLQQHLGLLYSMSLKQVRRDAG